MLAAAQHVLAHFGDAELSHYLASNSTSRKITSLLLSPRPRRAVNAYVTVIDSGNSGDRAKGSFCANLRLLYRASPHS